MMETNKKLRKGFSKEIVGGDNFVEDFVLMNLFEPYVELGS